MCWVCQCKKCMDWSEHGEEAGMMGETEVTEFAGEVVEEEV